MSQTGSAAPFGLDPHRTAEVVVTLQEGSGRRGSGYRVTAGAVLTAAHVVEGHERIIVRFDADRETEWTALATVAWASRLDDVAILAIPPRPEETSMAGAGFARVADVDAEVPCSLLGFPRFKLRRGRSEVAADGTLDQYRDSCHRHGRIPALSHRRQDSFEIQVDPPEHDDDPSRSPWEGMSGAAVFVAGHIVGVVCEHHRWDGLGTLTARRVDRWHRRLQPAHLDLLCSLIGLPATVDDLPEVATRSAITLDDFSGRWRPLRDAYLDPTAARAAILGAPSTEPRRPFIERRWLVREIDEFIREHDRGYFIVQADAGAGKTAFALWYSWFTGSPIHFTAHSADARTTASAVRNLVAQLTRLRGLEELAPSGRLPVRDDWSSWLLQVLTAAAEQPDADGPGRPVVLVVDGVDEAAERDGDHLPFGLPDDLPRGVYVVATVRTGGLPHQPKPPKAVCNWNQREPQQRADLRAFVTEYVQLRLMDILQHDGLSQETFVTKLLDTCGDNWLYATYVLDQIASGSRRPSDAPLLPARLEDYYHNTIERFCEQDSDAAWRMPLLATLAITMEPLDVDTLINLAGLDDHLRVRRFLYGPLRPFLTLWAPSPTGAADGSERLSLKHLSFREYLITGPGPTLGRTDADLVENVRERWSDLAAQCRRAEHRLCDRYLTAWGGLDADLPALAARPSLAQSDGGYPLRWLATHLLATGRDDDLHKLLACGRGDRNVWHTAHESAGDTNAFLNDVALARRALGRSARGQPGPRQTSAVLGLRIRYALVEASVATTFTNIPPDLIGVLVNRGKWSLGRALTTVERITDRHQRAQAMLQIIDSIPDAMVPDAWSIAITLPNGKDRCQAMAALIPRLPGHLLDGAIRAVVDQAARFTWETSVLSALAALVERLPDEQLNNIPWSAMFYVEKTVIASLIPLRCALPGSADRLLECLVRDIYNEFFRCQYLAGLMPYLPAMAFHAVMGVVVACSARYRGDVLVALVRHAPVDRLTEVLNLASDDISWIHAPFGTEQRPWLPMTQTLGPRLVGSNYEAAALRVALALPVAQSAEAIELLAPYLSENSAREALRYIEIHRAQWESGGEYHGIRWLMIAVGALAKRLPEAAAVVERYVKEYCGVDGDLRLLGPRDNNPWVPQSEHLAAAAAFLPRETVRRTMRSICFSMTMGKGRAESLAPALSRLAPRVGADVALVREAFDMMLDLDVWEPASRLTVLSVLAPHLDDDALSEAMERVLPGPVEVECFAAIADLGRQLPDDARTAIAQRVLATVPIADSSRRLLAVAALAPMLPTGIAETALEFVESIPRTIFAPGVLKTLDALAPNLPEAALPRALEIFVEEPAFDERHVQQMSRLFERLGRDDPTGAIRDHFHGPAGRDHPEMGLPQPDGAVRTVGPDDSWLRAIAPFLSASLSEEALTVAQSVQGNDARLLSMAALVPRLPEALRPAVAHEVLELLDVTSDRVDVQIPILTRLAEATCTEEVTDACQQLLTSLDSLELYSSGDWRTFGDFLTHLPSNLIDVVLRFSSGLLLGDRCRVIRMLAPRLPHDLLPDLIATLERVAGVSDAEERERERALVALAVRMLDDGEGQDEGHRILSAALDRAIKEEWSFYGEGWSLSVPVLVDLIPLLPPSMRSQVVATALQKCFDAYRLDRVDPLLDVLEGAELKVAFSELGRIRDPHKRAARMVAVLRRVGAFADRSTTFQDVDVVGGWPSGITRAELSAIVGASAWWIYRQGGDRAVAAAIDTMEDVFRWWR